MPLTVRHWLEAAEQDELWRGREQGQAFSEIGRALARPGRRSRIWSRSEAG